MNPFQEAIEAFFIDETTIPGLAVKRDPNPLFFRAFSNKRPAGPAVALLDVAPIGPDHLPGHAYADTLS